MILPSLALLVLLAGPAAAQPSSDDVVDVGGGLSLTRTPGGGYAYEDADAGFTAEIDPDGTVRFRDRGARPQKGKVSVAGHDVTRKGKREPIPAKPFRPDLVPYGPYGAAPMIVGVGGRMGGAADAKASARKYAAKQRFMELTASLRAELRGKARDKATRTALFELGHELLAIWTDPALPLSVRKERIFTAWDECAEPERGDDPQTHPGARARRRIEQFVRVHAKRGSDDGFTDAELRDFNARRKSRAPFAPYDR